MMQKISSKQPADVHATFFQTARFVGSPGQSVMAGTGVAGTEDEVFETEPCVAVSRSAAWILAGGVASDDEGSRTEQISTSGKVDQQYLEALAEPQGC